MFEQEIERLKQEQLLRQMQVHDGTAGPHITINSRKLVLLCSNDYLGLAAHPALAKAATTALNEYGFGAGASRLVSGTTRLHEELENRIARFKGTEAALVFNSGYAANTGIIPVLAGAGDIILSDSLNHASIIDGCRLSRAETLVYRHGDMHHLEELLTSRRDTRKKLIVTDGVFSMDGDLAPLPSITCLADQHGATVMVDDAHGTGVLGSTGKGIGEHFGISGSLPVQMGTFGKALGSCGAYVAGSRDLITYLLNSARSFIFSTALPPAVCAASLAAIDFVDSHPELRERLWRNRERFCRGLLSCGITIGNSGSPIIPVIAGESSQALAASQRLFELGIYAAAIRPPTVPPGSARIRATVMASHSECDIDQAIEAFACLKREGLLQ